MLNKERNKELIKKFNEAGLEPKIIYLAQKAGKNGYYDEAIGLLDNLLLMGSTDKKISELAIKFQKEKLAKEQKEKTNSEKA